jgi:hypothetical protein
MREQASAPRDRHLRSGCLSVVTVHNDEGGGAAVRIDNDPFTLAEQVASGGEHERWCWRLRTRDTGPRTAGRAGAPGVAAAVDIYPDLGFIVVVLANYDGAVTPIQDRIREILTGATPRPRT